MLSETVVARRQITSGIVGTGGERKADNQRPGLSPKQLARGLQKKSTEAKIQQIRDALRKAADMPDQEE